MSFMFRNRHKNIEKVAALDRFTLLSRRNDVEKADVSLWRYTQTITNKLHTSSSGEEHVHVVNIIVQSEINTEMNKVHRHYSLAWR